MISAAILVAVWMLKPSVVQPPTGSFHDAVDEGYLEVVKQHLAASPNVNAKDVNGSTPLYIAAGRGHKEVAALLIANGADVNAKTNKYGWTPLHRAASEGHKEIVELLIAKGADVNAKKKDGWTPLHYAATKEIAELLITEGADVNVMGKHGWTPLHRAASAGYKEIAELLIANGADVNARQGNRGGTPLDFAMRGRYLSYGEPPPQPPPQTRRQDS
jgi:ankyrin repeat protein